LIVKVQYFAELREIVNQREESLDVENPITVIDLLKMLALKHGDKFRAYVFDPSGVPRPYLQFLLNGESIARMNGFETELQAECRFAIIPPVGGG